MIVKEMKQETLFLSIMEYNKEDNETIVLLKGLKRGNAQKLKWTLTQSGFIISYIIRLLNSSVGI